MLYNIVNKLKEVAVERVTISVGLTGGPSTRILADKVDSHPLMELAGITHEFPDLLRMVSKVEPDVLILSPSMAQEFSSRPLVEIAPLFSSLCFIIWEGVESESQIKQLISVPLRLGGVIDPDWDAERLYGHISIRLQTLFSVSHQKGDPLARKKDGNAVYMFTGSKGGSGSTLLSLTLSRVLARLGKKTLLMELDAGNSQLGAFLEGKNGKTVLELLPLADDLSWDMVSRGIHKHPDGFFVLPFEHFRTGSGSEKPSESGSRCSPDWESRMFSRLFRNLTFLFDQVVVDGPTRMGGCALQLLSLFSLIFIVCTQDALSVYGAGKTCEALRKLGYSGDRVKLVLNRFSRRSLVEPHHITRATSLNIAALIPDRPHEGRDFAELGKLPSDKSPIYGSMRLLAQRYLGNGTKNLASCGHGFSNPSAEIELFGFHSEEKEGKQTETTFRQCC